MFLSRSLDRLRPAVDLKTERLTADVPLGLRRAVERVAGEQGVSTAAYVRRAVADQVLREAGNEPAPPAAKAR